MKEVPEDIPDDTILLDLQNNKIAEIKENDFKNLKGLQVSHFLLLCVLVLKLGDGLCNHSLKASLGRVLVSGSYSCQVHGSYSPMSFRLWLPPAFPINTSLTARAGPTVV